MADIAEGELHVYGRDQTIAGVRARAARGVRVRGHGAGMGVAIVAGGDVQAAAESLAQDVIAFDQRGCLSPRVAFSFAEDLPEALHAALGAAAQRVPRGLLFPEEGAEAARYADTATFSGRLFRGREHLVGTGPLLLPPPGRHVHVVPVATERDLAVELERMAPAVVAVGAEDPERFAKILPRHARTSRLGEMQRPRLDGPVDLRRG